MAIDGFTVTVGKDPLVPPNERLGCRASLTPFTSEPPDVSVSVTPTVLLPRVQVYVAIELGGSEAANDLPPYLTWKGTPEGAAVALAAADPPTGPDGDSAPATVPADTTPIAPVTTTDGAATTTAGTARLAAPITTARTLRHWAARCRDAAPARLIRAYHWPAAPAQPITITAPPTRLAPAEP
jgi:hypothetical protein